MRATREQPWTQVGVDLCTYAGQLYLVAYDAYSNYPGVEHLPEPSSRGVTEKLSSMFARHGILVELCSDNGPQFNSAEF